MTSVSQHMMSHNSNHHHNSSGPNLDNHLDDLLSDLQSGVGHRGELVPHNAPLVNGSSSHHVNLPPGATGYREVTTTVTQERNGIPTSSRDYQIEYLNPANSVTVLSERANSPNPETFVRNVDGSNQQVSSYKTSSYQYSFNEKTTDGRGNPIRPGQSYSVNKSENIREGNALNKNLNELDVLLNELNTAQRTPNPPRRTEHVSRSIESRSQSSREYPQSSTPRSASLTRDAQKEIQQYSETPGTPRAPQRGINVHKEVNTIEQRGHTSRRDSPSGRDRSVELSPTLRRRTPSPSGEFRPATFSSYPISPYETQQIQSTRSSSRGRSQTRWEESQSSQTQSQSDSKYRTNYVTHASTTRSDDAQPYRSPSPVSFPQHPGQRSPSPIRRSVSRSNSGRTLTYQVSPTSNNVSNVPQQYQTPQQFPNQPPLSDPTSPTVITYKYSSHSQQTSKYPGGVQDDPYSGPRPFPTPTPLANPGDQSPPKKLDDLMATFNESNMQRSYTSNEQYYRELENQQRQHELQRSPSFERNIRPSNVKATQMYHHQPPQTQVQPVNEFVPPPSPPAPRNQHHLQQNQNQNQLQKSVAGPPVYYPPGVELFAKKEESYMEQENGGGKGKMKGKMKYKYEASEKSKQKKSSGVAAVPVCLPLCCAMPCSIM